MSEGYDADEEAVDPEALQQQLAEIKGAMGLAEQYPGRARLWLYGGLLIGVAALVVQVLFFQYERLGSAAYTALWFVFAAAVVAVAWWMTSRLPQSDAPANAPSWRALFAGLAAFLLSFSGLAGEVAVQVDDLDRALLYFGAGIATIGLGLVVAGAVLSAYNVRRRDRLVFYAGGAWVLVYASWIPHVQILRWMGVGIFGVLFALYAVAAYAYLSRA